MADYSSQPDLSLEDWQTLLLTGQAISQERDEGRVCRWICDAAASLLDTRLASVFLTSPEHKGTGAVYGKLGESALPPPILKEISDLQGADWRHSEQSGRVSFLPPNAGPAELSRQGIRQLVMVDLRMIHQLFGMVIVGWARPRKLVSETQFVLTTLANQGALALEACRLREESAQRAKRLETFNELMLVAASTLDISEVFEEVGRHVRQLIHHDRLSIALHQPPNEHLDVYALAHDSTPIFGRGASLPLRGSASGDVVLSSHSILRGNLPEDGVYPSEVTLTKQTGLRSIMYVPLETKGRTFGSLNIASAGQDQYSADDLLVAQGIATHLAVILEHTLLYRETRDLAERLQTLNDLMHIATSTLDKEEAFTRIEQQVRLLIDHDRFSIALRPPGEDYLEMYAVALESQRTFPRGTPSSLQSLQTPMGEVALTGRPLIRRNQSEFTYPLEYEMARAGGYNSAMFVPLESRGRVIGSLNMASSKVARFSDREMQIAQRIAEHLSVIVEHATLYEESKRSEEGLRRLNRQLEDANRHKSEFLANMSHELRTPLNAILGGSELLGDEIFGPLNEKQAEYIQDINQCGTHLLSLINDVLDLSRVEAGRLDLNPSEFAISSLMSSCATIIRDRAATKSIDFRTEPPVDDIVLYADERKLKQVIYNLLSNAVKFTPENGSVVFRTELDADNITFVVEDTGPGVAEEWRERIFGEFFQIPGTKEGTGLGLAVSKQLVELHGGRIWPESNESRGSRFMFTIPVEQPGLSRST